MPAPKHWLSTLPPPLGLTAGTWRDDAACAHSGLPAETWDDTVPSDNSGTRPKRIKAAQAVCATCPVRVECFDDIVLAYDEGVRGGIDLRTLRAPAAAS